ncbi:MAG: hypothetical protein GY841_16205 [FCB group bacterium]|nr:hypothetical protein [FCB group bacterium]
MDSIKKLRDLIKEKNIADALKEDVRDDIGRRVCEDFNIDWKSREEAGWHETNKEVNELARQLNESKTCEGGEIVSNIKFPSIATAIIQFHARAYPAIIKGREVAKCAIIGNDPDGKKSKRGSRVSTVMNYQLTEEMDGWEEDMDKGLHILGLTGSIFKKTYRCPLDDKNKSPLVLAEDLVVNYWTTKLEDANRITHVLSYRPNEIEERIRSGVWLKHEYLSDDTDDKHNNNDDDRPRKYLEQHRWWDLDGDGYEEPYIITVHKDSEKVVQIIERFDIDSVLTNDKGEIYRIPPIDHFTHYWFMPSLDRPDEGSGIPLYGMGFGSLLSPITRAINSTLNQLIESGTMYTRGGGFIGDNVKFGRSGSLYFRMNEWKRVKFRGQKLADSIVPMPTREPSTVLFQLLGLMIDSSKELASMSDVLAGQNPGRDVPATTTMALIEQGLKVFSAVYKRIHKSIKSELKKLRRLNSLYMLDEDYLRILDDPELGAPEETNPQIICQREFSAADHDIVPISDEADITDVQKLTKAQALMELRGSGLPEKEIYRRYLEALRVSDIDKLIGQFQPPQDPKTEIEMKRLEIEEKRLVIEEKRLQQNLDKNIADAMLKGKELEDRLIEIVSNAVKNYAATAKSYADADKGGTEGKGAGKVDEYIDKVDEAVEMLPAYQKEVSNDEEGVRGMVEPPGGEMVQGADLPAPPIPEGGSTGAVLPGPGEPPLDAM